MKRNDLNQVIDKYLNQLRTDPEHRFGSWDFCYSAFNTEGHRNELALELGFYLASWGMYRGSSGLLQKNYKVHLGAVDTIRKYQNNLKCVENRDFSLEMMGSIFSLKKELESYYRAKNFIGLGKPEKSISPTTTLVSKIMLGTLACVPAYDNFFISGLNAADEAVLKFNRKSLTMLSSFITANDEGVSRAQESAKEITDLYYPKMKIIDMYFWQIGYTKLETKRTRSIRINE